MERVTEADLPDVTRFLEARMDRAMFPLNNLRSFGLDGEAALAPRLWAAREAGNVTGVFCQLTNKTVMPICAPELTCAILKGRALLHLIGPTDLVRPVIETLELSRVPHMLNRDEPHMTLSLSKLHVPEGSGALKPLSAADPATILAWREADLIEALGYPPDKARKESAEFYAAHAKSDRYRVLMDGDTPLSITGFNAVLPEIVQIGGVYTPPQLRNRGHARRAVALHLAQARAQGVRQATLFSNGPAAQRAYEAIGFTKVGGWTLFLRSEAGYV